MLAALLRKDDEMEFHRVHKEVHKDTSLDRAYGLAILVQAPLDVASAY